MFYIDSNMTGAPSIQMSSQNDIVNLLKMVLIDGVDPMIPDSVSGNTLIFNSSFTTNELTIYKITDGNKSVFSRINPLNTNEFLCEKDISLLNKNSIRVEFIRPKNWEFSFNEEAKESIFSCPFASIIFQNNRMGFVIKRGNLSKSFQFYALTGGGYSLVYTDSDILLSYEGSGYILLLSFCNDENLTSMYDAYKSDRLISSNFHYISNLKSGSSADLGFTADKNKAGATTIMPITGTGIPSNRCRFLSYGTPSYNSGSDRFSVLTKDKDSIFLLYKGHAENFSIFEFKVVGSE